MEEIYILKEGSLRTSMSDEHAIATIIEKYVDVTNAGVFVLGEQNSSIITFKINRFYDGVDLSEKEINVMYKNSNGIFKSEVYNVEYSETNLRFSWIIPADATKTNKVVAYIAFVSEGYMYKTKMFTLEVDKSFGIENSSPSANWFVTIEGELGKIDNKLSELDKNKASSHHSHTAEEVGALPEDTEIPDITDLENRVSELERGGTSGVYIEPKWEKVAEIPMNTETVMYELASTNDYHDFLVLVKRVKATTGSGNVFFRLASDLNYYVMQNTNLLGSNFGYTNTVAHLSLNGDIIETMHKSSNNAFTGTPVYSIYENGERFKKDAKFVLVMMEEWAQATSVGDTITVYGRRS